MKNLFEIPPEKQPGTEFFETLITGKPGQGEASNQSTVITEAKAPPAKASPKTASCFSSVSRSGALPGLLVERIISQGETTPEGEWYDQESDEWVAVLEGEARLAFADGSEHSLKRGEHIFLPKHLKHRVVYTSTPCIWLAVHGDNLAAAPAAR